MPLGHTCDGRGSFGAISIFRFVGNEAAPGSGTGRSDWILCQITSNAYGDARAIQLADDSFESGSLRVVSYARPGKLFTASDSLVVAEVAKLKTAPFKRIVDAVVDILKAGVDA
jgi:mRNA interferase MazF